MDFKVFNAHQGCIYLIKYTVLQILKTVTTVVLLNVFSKTLIQFFFRIL